MALGFCGDEVPEAGCSSHAGIALVGERDGFDKGAEVRARVLAHGLRRLCEKDLPGEQYAERYLRHKYRINLSAGTIRCSVSFLVCFLVFLGHRGKRHLEQISRGDLEAFIEHEQDRGLDASTVSTKVKQLKAFVRFLIEGGIVRPEVLSRRLTVRVPEALARAMEAGDLQRLLDVVEEVRDQAMVLVLLRTGMRIGELLATTINEVLIQEGKILIYEAEKNRVGRVVYLSDDAVEALEGWLDRRDPQRLFLFYGAGGKGPMCYGTAWKMFHRYLVKAGLAHKGYTLHSLRHTFATQLLNAGMRLECLQPLLGHKDIEVTRRYAKLTDKSREEEYFRAMARIEKEGKDVRHRLDSELEALFEEEELLEPDH